MTAHSRTLSLDYFLNSLRYMQEQIQSEDSFVTIFSNALRLMDNVMSGFDFETCKSMKALWKHFCPSTLFSESLYYVESKLRQINSALDNYKPDQGKSRMIREHVFAVCIHLSNSHRYRHATREHRIGVKDQIRDKGDPC